LLLAQGFKTTNQSCSISIHKISIGISIQIQFTNDIFQYPKNQISSHG